MYLCRRVLLIHTSLSCMYFFLAVDEVSEVKLVGWLTAASRTTPSFSFSLFPLVQILNLFFRCFASVCRQLDGDCGGYLAGQRSLG
ncbi:hypothetical protein FPQ18DRAFT_328249, partial [Pyronema domesticum]